MTLTGPSRTIVVEPVELPEPARAPAPTAPPPDADPAGPLERPEHVPEEEPAPA